MVWHATPCHFQDVRSNCIVEHCHVERSETSRRTAHCDTVRFFTSFRMTWLSWRTACVLSFSILNFSFSIALRSLEVALALPRCHHLVEFALFGLDEVQVVLGHIRAKGFARELAVLELVDRLTQRAGYAW